MPALNRAAKERIKTHAMSVVEVLRAIYRDSFFELREVFSTFPLRNMILYFHFSAADK